MSIRAVRQLKGSGVRGFSVPPAPLKFVHPWKTTARYNAAFERWEVRLRAGYVNGLDPVCHGYMPGESVPNLRELELSDGPVIPIQAFREPGGEGDPLLGFFRDRGVREIKNNLEISDLGGVVINTTPDDETGLPAPRILRAVDFYVSVARATYQASLTPVDGSGASGLVVDYQVSYDTTRFDQVGPRARLQQIPKFQPVKTPTFQERLLGQYQDEGEDRLWISTVFLLSPPRVIDGEPDGAWTPYVLHNDKGGYWNLMHAPRNVPPSKPTQPLRLFTGLGVGFLDIIANQMLAGVNELTRLVSNALNNTTNEGKFWSI